MKQIDERTILFSRMNLIKGSKDYEAYYRSHPEHKEMDDHLRSLPNLCSEGTAMYNPITAKMVDTNFEIIEQLSALCDVKPAEAKVKIDQQEATVLVKKLAKHYGADLVGITKMAPWHYYSVRGRRHYGEKITNHHAYGIVIAMEMDKAMVNRAPKMDSVIETSNIYLKLAVIGHQLAMFLNQMGYASRNHMDGNYLVVAPLVAQSAGLGEIGRHGLLLTENYGSRVRLGVVTTNLELIEDEVGEPYLSALCEHCMKCVKTCPGKAIPTHKRMIDGVHRYQINQEKCYEKWRSLGTDCGICLSSCPLSQGHYKTKLKAKDYEGILKDYEKDFPIRPYIKDSYF